MRRIVMIIAVVGILVAVGPTLAANGQTIPSTPGQVDALQISGSVTCTAAKTYEISWTLTNTSGTTISFLRAELLLGSESHGFLDLSPIAPGQSTTVTSTFPGNTSGIAVLQTEAYFDDDQSTGGPVAGQVTLPGDCIAPAAVAPQTSAAANYTG